MKPRRFIFVKDYVINEDAVCPKGTQIDLVEGRLFMQSLHSGGQLFGYMHENVMKMIKIEEEHPNYLREVPVPYNKA